MLNEFREFIAKGKVMDLAVGVIIGAAFQKIVDSLVNDVVMPVVGLAAGATVVGYGAFVTQVLQFLILAWIVFLMVKAVNRIRRQPSA